MGWALLALMPRFQAPAAPGLESFSRMTWNRKIRTGRALNTNRRLRLRVTPAIRRGVKQQDVAAAFQDFRLDARVGHAVSGDDSNGIILALDTFDLSATGGPEAGNCAIAASPRACYTSWQSFRAKPSRALLRDQNRSQSRLTVRLS